MEKTMKNKLFTILLLISLLLLSSCELIAQSIAGEKADGVKKLLEGSCVTIKDQDDNIIKTIPLDIIKRYMVIDGLICIDESELLIDDYKIDLDIELQDGFLRKKKGYVNSFYIDGGEFYYEDAQTKIDDNIYYSERVDDKSKLHLEYLNEGDHDLDFILFELYLKDTSKDKYEINTYLTINIRK